MCDERFAGFFSNLTRVGLAQQSNLLDLDEEVDIAWNEAVFPQRLYLTRFDERATETRFADFQVNNVEITCRTASDDDEVLYKADGSREIVKHVAASAATNKKSDPNQITKMTVSGELQHAYVDLTPFGRVSTCTVRAANGPGCVWRARLASAFGWRARSRRAAPHHSRSQIRAVGRHVEANQVDRHLGLRLARNQEHVAEAQELNIDNEQTNDQNQTRHT